MITWKNRQQDATTELEDKMKQYWMKIKYEGVVAHDNPHWQLTRGQFRTEEAVYKAYEAQAEAFDYEILEVKPHEQFEFALKG